MFKQSKLYKNLSRRTAAIIMSIVILLGAFIGLETIPTSAKEYNSLINNYYPLKGASSDSKFYQNSDWSFEGKNFMDGAEYETSSSDFEAPEATVSSDGAETALKWTEINGADRYRVCVYDGVNKIDSATREVSGTDTVLRLTVNREYTVQICALDSTGKILKASKIRSFVSYNAAANETLLTDEVKGSPTSSSQSAQSTLGSHTLPNGTEALVFWYGSENKNGTTNTWIFPDFKLDWSAGETKSECAGANTTVYFISDSGEIFKNSRGSSDYNTWHFLNEGSFKSGYVVIPLNIYKDGSALGGKKADYSLTLQNLRIYTIRNGVIKQNAGKTFGNRDYTIKGFSAVSDLNLYMGSRQSSSFSALGKSVYTCDKVDETKQTLTNSETGSSYSYKLSGESGLFYNLIDSGAGLYGMSLKFTAPESARYDVTNYLKIVNNNYEATVYYRVLKENGSGGKEQIWPKNQNEWYSLTANSEEYNPGSPLELLSTDLKKGESLRFEAYADVFAESGGTVNIRLVNLSLSKTERTNTSKGASTSYRALTYMDCFRNTGSITSYQYYAGNNRWNFNLIDFRNGGKTRIPMIAYDLDWQQMSYNQIDDYVGVYTSIYGTEMQLLTQTTRNVAVSMDFTSTESGTAVISSRNEKYGNSAIGNIRVMKNDVQFYPTDGTWSQAAEGFTVSCDVEPGDIISIQQWCAGGRSNLGDPIINILSGNTSNSPGSDYYAALWERPFKGITHNGKWNQNDSVWSFDLYDSGAVKGNSFSTEKGGLIYNDSLRTDDGYRFADDEIVFNISRKGRGFSLGFTAGVSGYYDFSFFLKKVSGNGKVVYRIRNGINNLYPESSWVDLNSEITECHEVYLSAGSVLYFEGYAESLTGDLKLSLGNPIVVLNDNAVMNESGKSAAYFAGSFIGQEKGFGGKARLYGKRYTYETESGGNIKSISYSDYKNSTLFTDVASGEGFRTENGVLTVLTPNGSSGIITFTSPRAGYGNVMAAVSSAENSEFNLEITVNGKTVYNETLARHTVDYYETLSEGDTVVFKAKGAKEIRFETAGVAVDGIYGNENDPSASVFTASLALPYGDSNYNGKYSPTEKIWNFKTLDPDKGTAKNVDFYSSDDGKHLYRKSEGVGYYFENSMLFGDLKETENGSVGLSLEFISPSDNVFEFSTALEISRPANSAAKIYARIQKNGENVWPADSEWKCENAVASESLSIPSQILQLAKGDKLTLQVYAENITSDGVPSERLKIAFGAPRLRVQDISYGNGDYTAQVYRAGNYRPYIGMDYIGKYYNTENVWNFEFLDLSETEAPKISSGNSVSLNTLAADRPNYRAEYNIGNTGTVFKAFAAVDDSGKRVGTTGGSIRFVSPITGDIQLRGRPKVSGLQNGQKAYFRIVQNEKVIYPQDGGWETLDVTHVKSDFDRMDITVNNGDEILYQFYTDAEISLIENSNGKQISADFTVDPYTVNYSYITDRKTNFSFQSDMVWGLQLCPYWTAEYSFDSENPKWTEIEKFERDWNYWLAEERNYIGVGAEYSEAWISNVDIADIIQPSVSFTHTVPSDGYITIDGIRLNLIGDSVAGKMRITQNGEKIWPFNEDWAEVSEEKIQNIEEFYFQVAAGDKIRFEVSTLNPVSRGTKQMKMFIAPNFTYSDSARVYSTDKDIYGMLDSDMYAYFKSMNAEEFDTSPQKSMEASNNFLNAILKRTENWLKKINPSSDDSKSSDSSSSGSAGIRVISKGTPDQYIPGTESKIIKRRKKIIYSSTSGLPMWAVILIAAGSIAVAGSAAVIIIKIRKKRKASGDKK